ncbi:MAG: iron-sulfur cluster assembly protein [Erythrobacter sp.]|jgi:metal-sulfur cluster biosynthetic enzyme|nr:iron-sulfur cluster assembly protein [Erythrobacter sp.]
MTLDDRIRSMLNSIHDPCSIAAGRPTGLIDMGLVLGWEMEGRSLCVRFAVTFAGCTMAPHFTEAARTALGAFEEFDRVETRVDTNHVWERPASLRIALEGKPQAWRERVSQR